MKVLEYSSHEIQDIIIKELTKQEVLVCLLFDQFGNYVIQKALTIAKDPYFSTLINLIAPHMEKLKKMAFGLKLYNKLVGLYPELLEKAPSELTKKKISINLGGGQNNNKKRVNNLPQKQYNNFNNEK